MGYSLEEFENMADGSLRDIVEYYLNDKNDYSKQDLYKAFLAITRMYLDEMISARQIERFVIKKCGADAVDEFFEEVATSTGDLSEGCGPTEQDPVKAIMAQFDTIEAINDDMHE